MPGPPDLAHAARLPPRDAVGYFRRKGYAVSWNWWEVWETAHARAFTVAKAVRLDVLSTLRGALDRALAEGHTYRTFARGVEPELRRLGWWGRQMVAGPEGVEVARLGSPRRLRTVFHTNMRTAHAAARRQAQDANVKSRPFWMYSARLDARTRREHAALDGAVFRADDPIWDSHYPPNGWNCRCRVRALTEGQVRARGLRVRDSRRDGELRRVTQEVGTDKRTGEVVTRPGTAWAWTDAGGKHVLLPDPGWSHNPGASPFGGLVPGDRGAVRPLDPAVGEGRGWRALGLPPRLVPRPDPPRRERRPDRAERAGQVYGELPPEVEPVAVTRPDGRPDVVFARVKTPEGIDDVVLTHEFVDHVAGKRDGREQFAGRILPTLTDPAEVWVQLRKAGEKGFTYRRVFLAAFEGREPAAAAVAVEEHPKEGLLSVTFFPTGTKVTRPGHEGGVNGLRRGYLLYRRKEKEVR